MQEQTVCIITCSSVLYLIKLFSLDSLAEVNLNFTILNLFFEFKNSADWQFCRIFLMYHVQHLLFLPFTGDRKLYVFRAPFDTSQWLIGLP